MKLSWRRWKDLRRVRVVLKMTEKAAVRGMTDAAPQAA